MKKTLRYIGNVIKKILRCIGNVIKKAPQYSWYYIKTNYALIGVLIIVFFIVSDFTEKARILPDSYTNLWDPIFSVFSFIVVVGLTIIYVKSDWEKSLDKELIVHFTYKNEYVFSCYGANLLPNADMRLLAQQIGRQMNGGQLLNFNPSIELLKSEAIRVKSKNTKKRKHKWIKYYEINVSLTEKTKDNYTVWNINNNERSNIYFSSQDKVFTEMQNFTLVDLLSYDDVNFEKFKKLEDIHKPPGEIFITDHAIISENMRSYSEELDIIEVNKLIKDKNAVFNISNNDNVTILSVLLNKEIKRNGDIPTLENTDTCLFFKSDLKFENGKIYTKETIEKSGFSFKLLKEPTNKAT